MKIAGRGKVAEARGRTLPAMSTSETSRFVRLRVELVVEITDSGALSGAALDRLAAEGATDDAERPYTADAVTDDPAEGVAALVDPFDLVGELPGVELAQASWISEEIDYDPDSPEWGLGEDDVEAADDETGEDVGGRS